MQDLILTLHIIVCVLLVILILLQSGKEGMGVIFGGGNTSVFGSTGAGGILAKLTALMAIIFVITSLSYTYVTSTRPESKSAILDVRIEEPAPERQPAPPAVKADEAAKNEAAAPEKVTAPETSNPVQATQPAKPAQSEPAQKENAKPAQPEKPAK